MMPQNLDQPYSLDTSGLPNPGISLPGVDELMQGKMPGGEMGDIGDMGAMTEDPRMAAPQEMEDIPQMAENPADAKKEAAKNIAAKLGAKSGGSTTKMIVNAIKTLDNLADIMTTDDQTNAKAVRQMIKILAEILRTTKTNDISISPVKGVDNLS